MNKQDLERLPNNNSSHNITRCRHRGLRFAGYLVSCLAVFTNVGCVNPDNIDVGQYEAAKVISKGVGLLESISNIGVQKPTYSTTQPSTQPANPYTR